MTARAVSSVVAALALAATILGPAQAATPSFVQLKYATPQTNQANVPVAYTSAQTAGNTNIVAIGWSDATSNITSVTDSAGNSYQLAAPIRRGTNLSQAIYYASNIKAAASNTVTVAFSASVPYADVRITEYAGIASSSPVDGTSSANGSGTTANSGAVTTTASNALIFGAGMTLGSFTAPGSGFTTRAITSPDGDIVEDRIVSATGSYSATATSTSSAWVMQVVAFRPAGGSDTTPPTVAITSPAANAQVNAIVNVTADASDNVAVAGVQFRVDGVDAGAEDSAPPFALAWDTRTVPNGAHTLTARARDTSGNTTVSAPVPVNVTNSSSFQNEVLATGFNLPTSFTFLPDARMLVVELQGTIKVLPPPYTTPSPTPFLQLTNVGSAGVQQGIYEIALDPNFAANHYFYLFYTLGTPNRDRLSRFTANAALTGTVAGSEFVIYQDPQDANAEHHGGAISFGNDGKIYVTTGEHFQGTPAQDLTSPRGKILRFNMDGTVPTDNPFYDGSGPNVDSIWALGLRNPFRAYYDQPTGRYFIGDVGGNDSSTAFEEINLGARGANYGWPNCENGNCGNPAYTAPIYSYPHNHRDAAVVAGFVYHGTQFPSSYQGSFFFADYTQNWIKRLTFDANGNVSGVQNFEPADGSLDGPYGDIVYLREGPDGALYYIDLGYSDVGGTYGVSKIRRIRYNSGNLAPIAVAAANPTSGAPPLTVNFSSAGSSDPENQPLTYSWTFGDGTTSTAANPSHTYAQPGSYTARLAVSDGVNTTNATPLTISVGSPPVPTINSPQDGAFFVAGDVISYSGDATDPDQGTLPASAFTWNIDFLHDGHVHPGTPVTGVKSGTFTIPTTGHDFEGNTRYRIMLTVTDADGLTASTSVTIWPRKVNLSFDTVPSGLTLYLDGIAKATPFTYDTLIGFNHTVDARNQTSGNTSYTFASWSDGGAQLHTIVVPASAQSYTATFTGSGGPPPPISFVQLKYATPQTNQANVPVAYTSAQTAGNTNIVAIGWSDATSNITSVTDSAGNSYQLAAPIRRGTNLSQAIYYASNIKAAASNTVTVAFSASVPYADVRITEYAGIASSNPVDGTSSANGSGTTANSGAVTTTSSNALIFGAGMSQGSFTAAGSGFTTRAITSPDGDIVEDRIVSATGSYSATATSTSSAWVMQVVALKGAGGGSSDTTPPTAAITAPAAGATVSGTIGVSANASDNVGVAGVQFLLDGANLGAEDTTAPYTTSWDTTTAANGSHVLTARARDASGNTATSAAVGVTVSNGTPPPPPPISFVQLKYATPQTNQANVPVAYTSAQTAGNTNIVAIGWSDATSNITSVTDSAGNSYQLAAPIRRGTNLSQAIYYASNIKAAASNTVTVAFSASVPYADVRITEYAGIASSNPVDGTSSANGSGTTANSGAVTTTSSNALIFGAGMSQGSFTAAGSGFTTRAITSPDGDIVEDRIVSATGSYSATATSTSSAWVMQVVALKGAGGGSSDTTPPTAAITAPAAGATVSGTIGVSANASDNVGVAGVQFLLDGANLGAEDTTAPYTTSWDTTTAANGSHVLTARARDASGNTATSAAVGVTVSNGTPPPPPPISFVQLKYATPQTNQANVPVAYTSAQTAGNTNIVAIGWSDATSNITSVTDSAGNSYQLAAPIRRGTNLSQAIYYASNIKAAASNTVTVAFSASVPYADVRITEYAGIASSNPVDGTSSANGSGTTANSGAVTTTSSNALIFGAGMTLGSFTAPGSGFTTRAITSPDGDIVEDRIVSATGSYSATATSTSSAWVMQVVAFKGAT